MPQPPREKPDNDNTPATPSWSDDQNTREYYYDDAHGYETYVPEEADDELKTPARRQRPDDPTES